MRYVGAEAQLDTKLMKALDAHLQQRLYPTSEAVARYVVQRWGARYTASGMTAALHRLGYSYKNAKL